MSVARRLLIASLTLVFWGCPRSELRFEARETVALRAEELGLPAALFDDAMRVASFSCSPEAPCPEIPPLELRCEGDECRADPLLFAVDAGTLGLETLSPDILTTVSSARVVEAEIRTVAGGVVFPPVSARLALAPIGDGGGCAVPLTEEGPLASTSGGVVDLAFVDPGRAILEEALAAGGPIPSILVELRLSLSTGTLAPTGALELEARLEIAARGRVAEGSPSARLSAP